MSSSWTKIKIYRSLSCLLAIAASTLVGCGQKEGALNPASPDANLVAALAMWMFAVAFLVLLVTLGLLLVGISLQRRGARKIARGPATAMVLCGGVVAPFLAVAAISASGLFIGSESRGRAAAQGPTIEVVGERWWWEFRYLDENDEVIAKTANELHLPVGQRARLRLISENVIHSFWVPNLQGKTDLVPGTVNMLFTEPEVAGVWRGQCAELCGLQHAMMGFMVVAQPVAEFDAWLAQQAEPAEVDGIDGSQVFIREGCAGCHAVRGFNAGGDQGPDLTHLASRRTIAAATLQNNRENLRQWITAGQDVKPGNLMPEFSLPEAEISVLLDFLEALK